MGTITSIGNTVATDSEYGYKAITFSDGSTGLLGLSPPGVTRCTWCSNKSFGTYSIGGAPGVFPSIFVTTRHSGTCRHDPRIEPPCVHVGPCFTVFEVALRVAMLPGRFARLLQHEGSFIAYLSNGNYVFRIEKHQICNSVTGIYFFVQVHESNGTPVGDICGIFLESMCKECVEIEGVY